MSLQDDLALVERAAEGRGCLLRAEAMLAGSTLKALALTFDVGRLVIQPDVDGLSIRHATDREALPGDLAALDEEEPWWRLLGQPMTAAWPGGVQEGVGASGLGSLMVLKLRFREAEENPRVVVIEATGASLRVTLED
jgi:hypothetical protein